MFAIIEFCDQEGGGLSIVHKQWVTPRKQEVFWPPVKDQQTFIKVLRKPDQYEVDTDTWKLYKIKRVFYETDDYEKANKKLKEAEVTSDIQTDIEQEQSFSRRRTKPTRFIESDSDDSEVEKNSKYFLPRPPKIKKGNVYPDVRSTSSTKFEPSQIGNELDITYTPSAKSQPFATSSSQIDSELDLQYTPTTAEVGFIPDIRQTTPSHLPGAKTAFQVLLTHLLQIKEQQKSILSMLEKSGTNISTQLPEDFPVTFPLTRAEDLETLEVYLRDPYNFQKLVKYLSTIGGGNVRAKTNKILRCLMTSRLAAQFNYYGRSRKDKEVNKKPFSELNLCKVLIDSVKAQSDFTTDMVEASIKNWLKHAPNRLLSGKYYKEVVGTRQIYRRINREVCTTMQALTNADLNLNEIEQNIDKSGISTNLRHDNLLNINDITDTEDENELPSFDIDPFLSIHNQDTTNVNLNLEYSTDISNQTLPSNTSEEQNQNNSVALDLNHDLRQWALRNKTSHTSLTDLLHVLSPFHPTLPLNSKTLLQTPSKVFVKHLDSGEYIHFGLENYLKIFLSKNTSFNSKTLKISINVDGLPLFTSSSVQFWPILGLIVNKDFITQKPFAIGVYCGKTKPSPLAIYLEDFIREVKHLLKEGFNFKQKYIIEIDSFICDAPARAFIKCVKSHGGYSSCDKCIETGHYVNRRVILNNISAQRRTDESFLSQLDEDHHIGVSPLTDLDIGMVSKFPVDYMHCLCLGVMKKLLVSWTCGNLQVRLSSRSVKTISESLIALRPAVTSEFNRKPRSLSELARFKATEFRTFLLYLGPVVLKNKIDKAIYEHFLLLHFSSSILLSERHLQTLGCNIPQNLLNIFINHCKEIYGLEYLVYNIHALCHLSEDASIYGSLNNISAFPFENYLGEIKRLIRSPTKPLQQLFRRLTEANYESTNLEKFSQKALLQHFNGPIPPNFNCKQYKTFSYKKVLHTIASHSNKDSYCLTQDNQVMQILNIIIDLNDEVFLMGRYFLSYNSFYTYPFESKDLNIFLVTNLSEEISIIALKKVVSKCMLLPFEADILVSFPLLHYE